MTIVYNAASSPGLFMRYERIKELHLHVMRRAFNAYRAIKGMIGINLGFVIRSYLIANRRELDC
jgi:hypothetical protein